MFDVLSKSIVDTMLSLGVWNDIIVNAVGVLALILLVTSYQMKNRSTMFNVYLGTATCWILYFGLQGNFASVLMNLVAVIRTFVFKLRGKQKWVDSYLTLTIFLIGMTGLTALSFRDYRDIFPLFATASQTVAFYQVKEKNIRAINLVGYVFWILNGITCQYWVALVCDSITFVSLIVAIYRFAKIEKKEAKKVDTTPIQE